jgi:tetratricopeptide (TPR) repeat protein
MTGRRRSAAVIAAILASALALPLGRVAFAEGITRVTGKVTDKDGKPLDKVPIYFEASEISKRVGPVRTNKKGNYTIATLDVSVAQKWRVIPELPGYKVVKVEFEIVDSNSEERGKGDHILGTKQEHPEITFALIGALGRNVVNLMLAREADFVAAVQAERKKSEGGGAASGGESASGAPAAAGAPAGSPAAGSAPAEASAPRIAGGAEMLQKAKQLGDAGRHAEAIEMYRSFLSKDPTGNPAVYYYLGKSLFESGDDASAEPAFRKGLELKADMKGAHFFLGNIYARQERPAEAAAEFEKELALTPDSANVYYNLGQAYARSGDQDRALAALTQATTLDPAKAEALMLMASIYEERKEVAKRDETYEKVKAVDPKNAAILFFNIGARARNENKNKEAVQAFRKSIEVDPTHAVAHRELAYALMGLQDFAGAVKHFQEYLRLDPRAPDAKEIQGTIAMLK